MHYSLFFFPNRGVDFFFLFILLGVLWLLLFVIVFAKELKQKCLLVKKYHTFFGIIVMSKSECI